MNQPDRDSAEATIMAEITPEMVTAGEAAFCSYDSRFEMPEDAVIEIYIAMRMAMSDHPKLSDGAAPTEQSPARRSDVDERR